MSKLKLSIPVSSLLDDYDNADVKFIISRLPIKLSSFFNNDDEKYSECIKYISTSYIHNLENGKHIPYLLYYQLFIVYLYKVFHIYKIYSQDNEIKKIIQDYICEKLESKKIYYNDMFDLSNISEDDFFTRINTLVRCLKKNHISNIKSLAMLRNQVAHIWGEISEEQRYDSHITIINQTIELINPKIREFMINLLKETFYKAEMLEEDYDKFIVYGYSDISEGIVEILKLSGTIDQKIKFIRTIYGLQVYICKEFESNLYFDCFKWFLNSVGESDEIYGHIEELGGVYKFINKEDIKSITEIVEGMKLGNYDKELSLGFLNNL